MRTRPPTRRPFREKLFGVWTALADDQPRRHIVGIVSRVAFMIESELLDSTVRSLEVIQLVREVPLPITARTRHGRYHIEIVWMFVFGHSTANRAELLQRRPSIRSLLRSGSVEILFFRRSLVRNSWSLKTAY